MKTYAAKTNALAADAVLTAAVTKSIRRLRPMVEIQRLTEGHVAPGVAAEVRRLVESDLLAAAQSAELLLDGVR